VEIETQTGAKFCVYRRQEGTYLGRDRRGLVPSIHIFAKLSKTDNQNLKTSDMNRSSTAKPESGEEFPDCNKPTKNSLSMTGTETLP